MKTTTKEKLKSLKEKFLDMLFPKHIKCIFCDEELDDRAVHDTCYHCLNTQPIIKRSCEKCGSPLSENNTNVCANCKANNFDYDRAKSVFIYENDVVTLMHRFKYSGMKFLAEPMSEYMCDSLAIWDIYPDVITSVPLHKNREKDRKYNQSKLLAENIAKKFQIPYMDLCVKIKDNPSQTTLDFKTRKENVIDAYELIVEKKKDIKGKTILLIDDIYTTGATVNEVTKLLKRAKANKVYVLTFAHGDGDKVR